MKRILIVLIYVSFLLRANAQEDVKSAVAVMNKCISGFSADQAQPLSFFAISGMLEQKQANLIQRISVSGIAKIKVETSKLGYSVTATCPSGDPCVNFVKSDMSTSSMESTSFFFSNPGAANTFATRLQNIIIKTRKTDVAGELTLYKDSNGQTPMLDEKTTPIQTNLETTAIPEEKKTIAKTNPNPTLPKEKTIREIQEEDTDTEEKKEDKRKTSTKEKKPKTTKEDDTEEEIDEKPTRKKTKKEAKEEEEPEINEELTKSNPAKKTKRLEEDAENTDDNQGGKNDLCEQLMAVVKSGLNTQFKDIQGKETNTEKKINESKIKLKGARKSYLSWFNNKRAFISELKLVDDNDFAIEEFQNLQYQLDECLAGWDDEDHSTDPVYDNVNYEVKDVEYTNPKDPKSPSIRIAIASEGKKFILFVRIH